jgi:hypothetical protein
MTDLRRQGRMSEFFENVRSGRPKLPNISDHPTHNGSSWADETYWRQATRAKAAILADHAHHITGRVARRDAMRTIIENSDSAANRAITLALLDVERDGARHSALHQETADGRAERRISRLKLVLIVTLGAIGEIVGAALVASQIFDDGTGLKSWAVAAALSGANLVGGMALGTSLRNLWLRHRYASHAESEPFRLATGIRIGGVVGVIGFALTMALLRSSVLDANAVAQAAQTGQPIDLGLGANPLVMTFLLLFGPFASAVGYALYSNPWADHLEHAWAAVLRGRRQLEKQQRELDELHQKAASLDAEITKATERAQHRVTAVEERAFERMARSRQRNPQVHGVLSTGADRLGPSQPSFDFGELTRHSS